MLINIGLNLFIDSNELQFISETLNHRFKSKGSIQWSQSYHSHVHVMVFTWLVAAYQERFIFGRSVLWNRHCNLFSSGLKISTVIKIFVCEEITALGIIWVCMREWVHVHIIVSGYTTMSRIFLCTMTHMNIVWETCFRSQVGR